MAVRTLPDGRPRPPMTGSIIILLVGTLAMVGVAFFIWSWGADDADEFRRGYLAIGPNAFEERMGRDDPFLLNVDESASVQIEGTDAFIPFDDLTRHPDLPEDKRSEILIYATTDEAAKAAARTLRAVGYEDIVDLKGGTAAWERAGKSLVPAEGEAAGSSS